MAHQSILGMFARSVPYRPARCPTAREERHSSQYDAEARGGPMPTTGATRPSADVLVASMPSAGLRWRRVFAGEERELTDLRRWLGMLLPERAPRDDVVSVATELASNAIKHTASGRG